MSKLNSRTTNHQGYGKSYGSIPTSMGNLLWNQIHFPLSILHSHPFSKKTQKYSPPNYLITKYLTPNPPPNCAKLATPNLLLYIITLYIYLPSMLHLYPYPANIFLPLDADCDAGNPQDYIKNQGPYRLLAYAANGKDCFAGRVLVEQRERKLDRYNRIREIGVGKLGL